MCEPTDEDLQRIREWNWQDLTGWFDLVESLWNRDYGKVDKFSNTVILITGGWADNESIISAMSDHYILWSRTWQASFRGGLYEFRLPAA